MAMFNEASSKLGVNGTVRTVAATPGSTTISNDWHVGRRGDTIGPAQMKLAFIGLVAGDFTAHAKYSDFKAWVASYYGLTIA